MEAQVRIAAFVIAVLVLAGAGAAAFLLVRAGDGGENGAGPSQEELQEYFREVRLVVNRIDDRTQGEQVQRPSEAFNVWALVLADSAAQLGKLMPPAEVKAAHDKLQTALDDGAQAVGALAQEHGDVTSLQETQEILNNDDAVNEAYARAGEACRALEQYAQDHDVSVDLELC